ncbi:MAG: hypothetical protein QG653_724 [Patescibacteria group bacterium]|nr:hypothetical protein [Patescibacteria group bacterium]
MIKNIGQIDTWIRVVVGALLMLYVARDFGNGTGGWFHILALFLGMILIGTAIVGGCYLYELLSINTRKGN